jgi:TatD DNase family protein
MRNIPFIDIHTHTSAEEWDTVTVRNIFPGEAIPAFRGKDFFSVGLHPWYIKSPKENNELLQIMEEALDFEHVIFAGEAGLDKYVNNDYEEQLRVFEAQAFIAEEFQKPLIIHCVRAYYDLIGIHNKIRPVMPWILHGYGGNPEITEQMLKRNVFFSFGGNILKERPDVIESYCTIPCERIYFETDESDTDIREIYEKGACLKNMSLNELKRLIWENFNRIENVSFNR